MKIEPKKNAKSPQYAAVLAAIASAAILTGCQTAGEVAIDGTAPDPNIAEQTVPAAAPEDDLELVGEIEVEPDQGGDDLELAGDIAISECEVDSRPLQLGGVIAMPNDDSRKAAAEPLTLEGDVAWVPDYAEDTDCAGQIGAYYFAEAYADAFAQAGIEMAQTDRWFSHYGTIFMAALSSADEAVSLAFYDGSAVDADLSMREWMGSVCTEQHDWGCVFRQDGRCTVFVDISAEGIDIAANAEQVVKDVIG